MLFAVAITGLILLIVLAVIVGLAVRQDDEVTSRSGRRPEADPD